MFTMDSTADVLRKSKSLPYLFFPNMIVDKAKKITISLRKYEKKVTHLFYIFIYILYTSCVFFLSFFASCVFSRVFFLIADIIVLFLLFWSDFISVVIFECYISCVILFHQPFMCLLTLWRLVVYRVYIVWRSFFLPSILSYSECLLDVCFTACSWRGLPVGSFRFFNFSQGLCCSRIKWVREFYFI